MPNAQQPTLLHYLLALIPAASLRVILGIHQTQQPVFEKYLTLGRELLSGRMNTPFSSSPWYIMWTGVLNAWCGMDADAIRWIQLALGILSVFLVVRIGSQIRNPLTGTLAGLLYGCLAPALLYESDLVTSSLEIILTLSTLAMILAAVRNPAAYHFIIAGILTGLTVAIRPNMLLLVPLVAIWIWFAVHQKSAAATGIILFGLFTAVVISPITLFNYHRSGEIIWITVSGGSVFYSSNNYRAEGLGYSPPQSLTELESEIMQKNSETVPVEHELFKYIAERAAGRRLTYREMSAFYSKEGLHFLEKYPTHAFHLFTSKFFYLFNNYEVLDTASLVNASSRIDRVFPFLPGFGLVSVLGLVQIARARRRPSGEWLLLLFIIPHVATGVMFYVNGRLRISMAPFLAILAAAAAARFIRDVKEHGPDAWIGLIWIMGATAFVYGQNDVILSHRLEQTPSFLHTMKGLTLLKSGRIDEAALEYETAAITHPLGAVEAYAGLAGIYRTRDLTERAEIALRLASGVWTLDELNHLIERRGPEFARRPDVRMALASSYQRMGKREEARVQYEEILIERPWMPDALYNLAMIHLGLSPPDCRPAARLIREALDCGLKLELHSTTARKKLLDCLLHLGNIDEATREQARIYWEESLPFQ